MRPGKYRIKNLGMKDFTGTVEVMNEAELLDECHKHLISAFVRIHWLDPSETRGKVLVGFGRPVGEVEYIGQLLRGTMRICLPVTQIKKRNERAQELPFRTGLGREWASLIMKDGSLGPRKLGGVFFSPFLEKTADAIGRIHFHPHQDPEPSVEDKRSALLEFIPERTLAPLGYDPRLYAITSEETNSTIVYVFPPKENFYPVLKPRIGKGVDLSVIFDNFVSEGVIKKYEFENTLETWCVELSNSV